MFLSDLQFLKASLPIEVTFDGRVTMVRDLHSMKALLSIEKT